MLNGIDGIPVTLASVVIGNADGPERHRRRVREQTDAGGIERRESEAGEHRAGHGDRCAEAGRAFDERAERKRDEHRLQAAIVGQAADRVLDDLEFAGVDREAVQHDRAEHDPRDRENTERRAVERREDGHRHRHAVGEERDDERRRQRGECSHPCRFPLHAEHVEQNKDGDRRRNAPTGPDFPL